MTLPAGAVLLRLAAGAGVPQPISRDQARRAAEVELSRPRYEATRPPLLYRLLGRLLRWLGHQLTQASGHVPGGRAGLLVLLAVFLLAAAVILRKVGPFAARAAVADLFAGAGGLDADEHRRLGEAAAAAGHYADAVRERMRAIVRELEARGVLDPRPGRTAGEVAGEAGRAVPELAAQLRRASSVFDEIWYGGRPADAGSYADLVEVDRAVTTARLVVR